MSDMRLMVGYVGPLQTKVSAEQRDDFNDVQYSNGWYINSECTLLTFDANRVHPTYQPEGFLLISGWKNHGARNFEATASTMGVPVECTMRFTELYYDGAEASIHNITLEDFEALK